MERRDTRRALIALSVLVLALAVSVSAQYAGGSGTAEDPYRIATVSELIALGENAEDYDKHFVLTADLDLDPALPGRKVFDGAVIGSRDVAFTGVFDGKGHRIMNLTISGIRDLGLFGWVGSEGQVRDLGLEDVNIVGAAGWFRRGFVQYLFESERVGGLVGRNFGSLARCYSTGSIQGEDEVGGLVGTNLGTVTDCYSAASVSGTASSIGGLIGLNKEAISRCYSAGPVSGERSVGGLVGSNDGVVASSFWDTQTSGQPISAGGVGKTTAEMQEIDSFSRWGTCDHVGVWTIADGQDYPRLAWQNHPGESIAVGATLAVFLAGTGAPEAPYLIYTADELRLFALFPCDWDKHFALAADIDLDPNLPGGTVFDTALVAYETGHGDSLFQGTAFAGVFDGRGHTISHLVVVGDDFLGLFGQVASTGEVRDVHMIDVDITGSGDCIGGLVGQNSGSVSGCSSSGTLSGDDSVGGLVGYSRGRISAGYASGAVNGVGSIGGLVGLNSGQVQASDSDSAVSGNSGVGGLAGQNYSTVTTSHSSGPVGGFWYVGGLIGSNSGTVSHCHSTSDVTRGNSPSGSSRRGGPGGAGGLVGENVHAASVLHCYSSGKVEGDSAVGGLVGINPEYACITASYSSGDVIGNWQAGGLVGSNNGSIVASYSSGAVDANESAAGGLVGCNDHGYIVACHSSGGVTGNESIGGFVGTSVLGSIAVSFCTGAVAGDNHIGGFIGYDNPNMPGTVTDSFWDVEASGLADSARGMGLTTAQMQDAATFLDAGWDFVDEAINGTCDYWRMAPDGYPELAYLTEAAPAPPDGLGTVEEPYLIRSARDLGAVWFEPLAHYRLDTSLDLSGITWSVAPIPWIRSTLDGNRQVVRNLHIRGGGHLGLVGGLGFGAQISDLGLEAVDVYGTDDYVGGLAGHSRGTIVRCYSGGIIEGRGCVGGLAGLAGYYYDSILESYSVCTVTGDNCVGGLVGTNDGIVAQSYSAGTVGGRESIGGLTGCARGSIEDCYSSGPVTGSDNVGGLAGLRLYSSRARGGYSHSCFWDIQTSGQTTSDCGVGQTTAAMRTVTTFLEAGWDFVGEAENGTEDLWWIDEGQDYPRLWWELPAVD